MISFLPNGLLKSGNGSADTVRSVALCRYTTFYILYPLGASSEALCIFATLPNSLPTTNPGAWDLRAYVYAGLFAVWWPGLYVMYTHMIKQRRKAIGTGFWGSKLVQDLVEKHKQQ